MKRLLLSLLFGLMPVAAHAQAPAERPCPASVAKIAKCYAAQDSHGAFLWFAIPTAWNKTLIVHAHGGPSLGTPKVEESAEDMDRFNVFVNQGFAWVSSTYRRGGYGVRMAAADVDNSRQVFWKAFGKPQRTILHGQSYGGNVAAKTAELYALAIDGTQNYDGVMLTNGLLYGGTRGYVFRADLRAVYQYYCQNHPGEGEAKYPVWQGLPTDSQLTTAELKARIDTCTGVSLKPSERTAQQAYRLKQILAVTGVKEKQLVSHMTWATFTFRDLISRVGGNPFDNRTTVYKGSDDDKALNAGIERFDADPKAVARLAYDADLSGLIVLPTVTIHAKNDPTVSFAAEAVYTETVKKAGRGDLLVQTATDEDSHSKLAETEYVALLQSLMSWLDGSEKPTPDGIARRCATLQATVPGGCHFVPAASGS
ncbi:hypothetical protein [Asticcacaulis sp. YBE204]|uniref:alpha/beta hydrolase n=1 Tax=Asticcacaulis sp. YBE204 TaxID=1282363 RepID=UPI0003C3B085|nr:hypothetical protein [Asticcacaulis sp. YBE204]ESQ79056.1 hypothetical protein AEYBE204_11570 [Asticcacaulis sp. YBE204]